jgi:hypothetical protein
MHDCCWSRDDHHPDFDSSTGGHCGSCDGRNGHPPEFGFSIGGRCGSRLGLVGHHPIYSAENPPANGFVSGFVNVFVSGFENVFCLGPNDCADGLRAHGSTHGCAHGLVLV